LVILSASLVCGRAAAISALIVIPGAEKVQIIPVKTPVFYEKSDYFSKILS